MTTYSSPIWILVDGNNHVHRDFHAAGGISGKVLTLLSRRLEAMRDQFTPERVVVALDSRTSWRAELDPTYKANRPEKPEELRTALAGVRPLCHAEEIDVVEVEGFEADDAIATLTRIAREGERRVVLASADKDLRQLLETDAVTQLLSVSRQQNHLSCEWLTANALVARYGVRPEQWIDYQTMCGDPGDNVTGASGIGEKTAAKILQRCGSLERYYADVWAAGITSRQQAILGKFRKRADLVRQLVTLRQDVPLPDAWMEVLA